MIVLARFILRGPSQTALVMATSALLAILLMPFSWLSAAALCLAILAGERQHALQATVVASLAVVVMSWIVFQAPLLAIGYLMFLWLPAGLVAYVLRQSVSLVLSMQILTALGLLFITGLSLLFPDMGQSWREMLELMLKPVIEQAGTQVDPAALENLMDFFARSISGLLSIVLVFNVLIGLIIARWWQAQIFNPGGLGKEFNELRLGKVISAVSVLLVVLNTFIGADWVLSAMLFMLSMSLLQGTAVMHGVIAIKQLSRGWMIGFYVLLLLVPQVSVILAIMGLLDAWVDIRKLVSRGS